MYSNQLSEIQSELLLSSYKIYLLCTRADLDGIGNQSSSFLSGNSDDIFKGQCNLEKEVEGSLMADTCLRFICPWIHDQIQ